MPREKGPISHCSGKTITYIVLHLPPILLSGLKFVLGGSGRGEGEWGGEFSEANRPALAECTLETES